MLYSERFAPTKVIMRSITHNSQTKVLLLKVKSVWTFSVSKQKGASTNHECKEKSNNFDYVIGLIKRDGKSQIFCHDGKWKPHVQHTTVKYTQSFNAEKGIKRLGNDDGFPPHNLTEIRSFHCMCRMSWNRE